MQSTKQPSHIFTWLVVSSVFFPVPWLKLDHSVCWNGLKPPIALRCADQTATLLVYATGHHSCGSVQHSEQMPRTTQEALCAHMLLAFRPLLKKDSAGDVQMMFLLDARKALSLILELNLMLFCLSLSDPTVFKHGKTSANKSFWAAKPASFGRCLVLDRCHVTVGRPSSLGSSHYTANIAGGYGCRVGILTFQLLGSLPFYPWLVVWNIFIHVFIFPYIGNHNLNWLSYFSDV